ncbi:MAG: c-type cytochrome [Myxococcota bacterium]
MRRRFSVITGALAVLLLLAPAGWAEGPRPEIARGAKLYSDNCGRCHNPRSPRELDDRQWPIVIQHMRIIGGIPGGQARAIAAFLKASNNPAPEPLRRRGPPVALSGSELIEAYGCRGCHTIGAQGGQVGPSLDTVFERRGEDWIRLQILEPREHNPATAMPDFGLSDAQVEAIIETLRQPAP